MKTLCLLFVFSLKKVLGYQSNATHELKDGKGYAFRELPYLMSHKDVGGERIYELKISQPQVVVSKADQYFCFVKYFEEIGEANVFSSLIEFDKEYIHHVSISYCDEPADFAKHGPWECSNNRDKFCPGSSVSGPFADSYSHHSSGYVEYPKDISVKVGSSTRYRYLVYETHFEKPVTEMKDYPLVNITLTFKKYPTKYNYQTHMMIASGYIPASIDKGYFAEIACPWAKPEVTAFAVSLHTHHYGYMAEVFRIRNDSWTLLASQLTKQRPREMYRIIGGFVDIRPGDILATRCLYINNEDKQVNFGLGGDTEMCNSDVSFGYKMEDEEHFKRTGACVTDVPTFSLCDHDQTSAICGRNVIG